MTAERYRYVVVVKADSEQGAIEASDRVARACQQIQEHDAVRSVQSQSDAPNDFRRGEEVGPGGESP